MVRFPFYGVASAASGAIEAVCRAVGITPPVFRRRLSWFITNREFRIDRAREELGYRPRVNLADGLARTAAWYRAMGYLPAAPATPERRRRPAGAPRAAGAPERRLARPSRPAPTSP